MEDVTKRQAGMARKMGMRKESRTNEEPPLYKTGAPSWTGRNPSRRRTRVGEGGDKRRVPLALCHRAMLTGGPANQRAAGVGAGQRLIRFLEVTVWPLSPCGGTPPPRGFREILVPSDRFRIGRQAWTHVLIRHSTARTLAVRRGVLRVVCDSRRGQALFSMILEVYTLHGAE